MPLEVMSAETLMKVGPRIEIHVPNIGIVERPMLENMVQEELNGIYRDLVNRPGNTGARELLVKFSFTPETSSQNRLIGVSLSTDVSSKVPKQMVPGVSLGVHGGKLVYRSDSIEDFRQTTLADLMPSSNGTTSQAAAASADAPVNPQ